ncbi:hypothetical protein [Streptosporangium longisporum]|uniref:Uncharacterized protein n=1 Tax=Streptosporangium longisporum TaxID=46187 RepID=A0ABP6KYS5_9ACTN
MAAPASKAEPPAEPPLKTPVPDTAALTGDAAPPYYIAARALFVDNQFGRAFNPGDRVPAEHVERFGWTDHVVRPDLAGADLVNEPATTTGQATNSKDGA